MKGNDEGSRADDAGSAANDQRISQNLCDSHTHIGAQEELKERKQNNIRSLMCATNPQEAKRLMRLLSGPDPSSLILPTFGLHPWYTDRYCAADIEPYFSCCPVIGEIGMDSVWCNVPLDIQERAFTRQLSMACEMKKPVILHTKGQEERIAALISRYPNTYLVHWYSSPDFPESYMDLDCYFSIGPDVWWNKTVRQLAAKLSPERILVETDGAAAVRWALEEAPEHLRTPEARAASRSVTSSLTHTLAQVADIRKIPVDTAAGQISRNFKDFLKSPLPL